MVTQYPPSTEAAIKNLLVSRGRLMEAPDVLISGRSALVDGDPLVFEDQANRTSFPASCTACLVQQEWVSASSCSVLQVCKKQIWELTVVYNRPVFTDGALGAIWGTEYEHSIGPFNLRLVSVKHIFRPDSQPEQGTHLTLTFEASAKRT